MNRVFLVAIVSVLAVVLYAVEAQKATPMKGALPKSNQVYVKIIWPADTVAGDKDRPIVESWIAEQLKNRGLSKFTAVTGWVPLADKGEEPTPVWNATLDSKGLGCPVAGQIAERADGRIKVLLDGWSPAYAKVTVSLTDEPGSRAIAAVEEVKWAQGLPYVAVLIGPPPEKPTAPTDHKKPGSSKIGDLESRILVALAKNQPQALQLIATDILALESSARRSLSVRLRAQTVEFQFRGEWPGWDATNGNVEFVFSDTSRDYESLILLSKSEMQRLARVWQAIEKLKALDQKATTHFRMLWIENKEPKCAYFDDLFRLLSPEQQKNILRNLKYEEAGLRMPNTRLDPAALPGKRQEALMSIIIRLGHYCRWPTSAKNSAFLEAEETYE